MFACTRGAGHLTPMVPFAEACRRAGHDVLVVGPPALADPVERAGFPFAAGAAPDEDDLGRVWGRVPALSYEEAERLVIGEIFATLNAKAMLPGVRAAVRSWRPDVVLREPAEFASAAVAEDAGVAHVQVAIGLIATQRQIAAIARDAVETWAPGLMDRIAATPSLTLFPAALEDPAVAHPSPVHRFRAPGPGGPARELPDGWPGDDRPLVYVTFGTETAAVPTAAPIYDVALAAVAGLEARVLLTTGVPGGEAGWTAPGPHVRVERFVPQADVLAHARVVVCHGGAGTTLGALAAGVPLVLTPLFADQPENARRVAAVGAGVVVEPRAPGARRSDVDPADLRDAISTVLTDDAYARAARGIAAEVRALPAVDDAPALLAALA
jgi:UDP:flavonoid glycosyltransferase YjiC (YdhE family)